MNVIFNAKLSQLFDFIITVTTSKRGEKVLEPYKDGGAVYGREVIEAYKYIWEGIDLDIPGLEALTARSQRWDTFFTSHFSPYVWDWHSIDVFMDYFDRMIHNGLICDMLEFYSEEKYPKEYYRKLTGDAGMLHDFVYKLKISELARLELLGIASGSQIYPTALRSFFKTVAERLDHIYCENDNLIQTQAELMQKKLDSPDGFFLMDEPEFKAGYDRNHYETARVVMSFINPILIYYAKNGRDVDVFLGMENSGQNGFDANCLLRHILFYKGLADESRIKIIALLMEREMFIGEISKALDIPLTTLSYHIRTLNEAGVIELRDEGKKTFCRFNSSEFIYAAQVISNIINITKHN